MAYTQSSSLHIGSQMSSNMELNSIENVLERQLSVKQITKYPNFMEETKTNGVETIGMQTMEVKMIANSDMNTLHITPDIEDIQYKTAGHSLSISMSMEDEFEISGSEEVSPGMVRTDDGNIIISSEMDNDIHEHVTDTKWK